MRTPVALVTAALRAAILLAASFLVATGTHGEGANPAIGRAHTPSVME